MSCLHRLSCGGQQSEDADRQQQIKPAIGTINGVARPEAAGSPEGIFRRHIAQHSGVEILQLARISRQRPGISKAPYSMIGNSDHHPAPEQIGENVAKGAVKCAQWNTDHESNHGFPARKISFLRGGKSILQDKKKNDACHPAKFRYIKDLRRFRE